MSEADYRRIVRRIEGIEHDAPDVPSPRRLLRDNALLVMILRAVRGCPPEDVEAALTGGLVALAACVEMSTKLAVDLKVMECPDLKWHGMQSGRCESCWTHDNERALATCAMCGVVIYEGGP